MLLFSIFIIPVLLDRFTFMVVYATILGLLMHATILAYMFSLVEMNKVTVPLGPNITAVQNMIYVQDFLVNLLKAAFPHLNE